MRNGVGFIEKGSFICLVCTLFAVLFPLPVLSSPLGLLVRLQFEITTGSPWQVQIFDGAFLLFVVFSFMLKTPDSGWRVPAVIAAIVFWICRVNDYASSVAIAGLCCFCWASLLSPRISEIVWLTLGCILAMNVCVALTVFIAGFRQFHTPGFGMRASGLYQSPNSYYPIALLSVTYFSRTEFGVSRKLRSVLISASVISLLLTFTRAGYIGLAALLLAISLMYCQSIQLRWISSLGSLFITLVGVFLRNGFDIAHDASATGRIRVWQTALNWFYDSPWFGHGLNSFFVLARARPVGRVLPNEPKNLIFAILLDGGIVGLIVTVVGLSALLTKSNAKKVEWRSEYFLLVLPVLVAGIFDTPIMGDALRIPGTALFFTLCGLTMGQSNFGTRTSSIGAGQTTDASIGVQKRRPFWDTSG